MAIRHLAGDSKIKVSTKGLGKGTTYTITVTNLTNGGTAISRANARSGGFIQTLAIDARGIVRVAISDGKGKIVKSYTTVGTAEIDCCIAKLVHDAINCTCKCNKCKEELQRAETVKLLLEAALYEATTGNVGTAQDKYNKAKELCVEVCACGC
jgi:hypothetical protein